MGAVSSRLDGGTTLFLKDQQRFSVSKVTITSSRRLQSFIFEPNAFPATALSAKRTSDEVDSPVPFILNSDAGALGFAPPFLLYLNNDEDITFEFKVALRPQALPDGGTSADTTINGLTFMFAPTNRDLDNLATREFLSDPNFHKNPNVELVGDGAGKFTTAGQALSEFTWQWTWRPPKQFEDKDGGWKTICAFAEYDQRAHRLETLAAFGFWVQNTRLPLSSPNLVASPPQGGDLLIPPKIRLSSSQSQQTVMSDSEAPSESGRDLPSPVMDLDNGIPISQSTTNTQVVDVNCPRPGDDVALGDDGPLFRATMKSYEQKTGTMKARMKKVLKKAEAAREAHQRSNHEVKAFMDALQEASASNANAVQPALDHYFQKTATAILQYEQENTANLQRLIIDPLSKVYTADIKQAESKRKDFEEESRDYYAYVSKYLGQRQDSKEKKQKDSDTKYQNKRRNFELKRFDYSSFMQDLHGGKKDQEVLSHLTKFAEAQAKSYLLTSKKIEEMMPQLEALVREVNEANKDYQIQRTEREEKRRTIEASNKPYVEPDVGAFASVAGYGLGAGDGDVARSNSGKRNSQLHHSASLSHKSPPQAASNGLAPSQSVRLSGVGMPSPSTDRFKGIRDLEDNRQTASQSTEAQRKEGLVWAMSKPGSHVDARALNKIQWHKFWLVLDQGRLSEYTNWKEKLELHMDPIDLRLASVREARDVDRRFCFELITPSYKRVYQAQSEEDMNNWINSINNALQSAYEGRNQPQQAPMDQPGLSRDIGSVLTGKSPSHIHHSLSQLAGSSHSNSNVGRRITVGGRPTPSRNESASEDPTKLLKDIRNSDQGNTWCADCGSDQKTEWVSINLGIILCIECSGIHRSLGTHISKIRSLTLDTHAFTSDIVDIIMQVGNRLSNQIWEAKLEASLKPMPNANREQRLRFIQAKYVDRAYVEPYSGNADDFLVASVKMNEIRKVLKALALRASPNAHDRSRNTHVVFLALAAVDPIMQGGGAVPGAPIRKAPSFPVAELLLQNGGEVPRELPAFPLSPAAKQFIETRRPRSGTIGETAAPVSSVLKDGGGDSLTALPTISANKSPGQREKLRKRESGGTSKFGIGSAF